MNHKAQVAKSIRGQKRSEKVRAHEAREKTEAKRLKITVQQLRDRRHAEVMARVDRKLEWEKAAREHDEQAV